MRRCPVEQAQQVGFRIEKVNLKTKPERYLSKFFFSVSARAVKMRARNKVCGGGPGFHLLLISERSVGVFERNFKKIKEINLPFYFVGAVILFVHSVRP